MLHHLGNFPIKILFLTFGFIFCFHSIEFEFSNFLQSIKKSTEIIIILYMNTSALKPIQSRSKQKKCPIFAFNNSKSIRENQIRKTSTLKIKERKKQIFSQLNPLQLGNNANQQPTNKKTSLKIFGREQGKINTYILPTLAKPMNKKYSQKQNKTEVQKNSLFSNPNESTIMKKAPSTRVLRLNSLGKSQNRAFFQYYISQIQKQLKKSRNGQKGSDDNSIFIQHMILSMCVIRAHKYTYIPKQIQLKVNISAVIEKCKNREKKILIFDMDQTLIHANNEFERQLNNGKEEYKDQQEIKVAQKVQIDGISMSNRKLDYQTKLYVNIRPYAKQVLKRLSQHYILGIFTAAEQNYADSVLKVLDPYEGIFTFKLFRQHCSTLNYASSQIPDSPTQRIKDLRILQQIELSRIIMIDNSPVSYLYQPQNAIPIIPFTDNNDDDQLLKLQSFLQQNIKDTKDVRVVLRQKFKIQQYGKYNNVKELMEKVFKLKDI